MSLIIYVPYGAFARI